MSPVSRGFRHLRRASDEDAGRVPPGQYVTEGFPVLSAGPAPHTPVEKWTLRPDVGGLRLRRRLAGDRARRPGPAAGAAPVLLEERQVGARPRPARTDEPGFWEKYGYHMYGDPWKEQRYAGD